MWEQGSKFAKLNARDIKPDFNKLSSYTPLVIGQMACGAYRLMISPRLVQHNENVKLSQHPKMKQWKLTQNAANACQFHLTRQITQRYSPKDMTLGVNIKKTNVNSTAFLKKIYAGYMKKKC